MVTQLREICYHEASHTVVALAVGARVPKVTLDITTGTDGPYAGGHCFWVPCTDKADQLAVIVAGVVGSRTHSLKTDHVNNGRTITANDEAAVRALLPYHHRNLDRIDDVLEVEYVQIQAAKILEQRWSQVQALADALLNKIELDEDAILEIVGRARSDALIEKLEKMKAEHPVPTGARKVRYSGKSDWRATSPYARSLARNDRERFIRVLRYFGVGLHDDDEPHRRGRERRMVVPPAL